MFLLSEHSRIKIQQLENEYIVKCDLTTNAEEVAEDLPICPEHPVLVAPGHMTEQRLHCFSHV